MNAPRTPITEPLLTMVIAPNRDDADVACSFLAEGGLDAAAAPDIPALIRADWDELGCAVIVQESLMQGDVELLQLRVQGQPAWSDLPLVIVATESASLSDLIDQAFHDFGNVTVLERPLNPYTLVSAVSVGIRARKRQLQVRELLDQRDDALRRRDEFLAMLGHELRNPLSPLLNASQLLKRVRTEDAFFEPMREVVERQVLHIARLVDDLLDVSRLEIGKVRLMLEHLELNRVVARSLEGCKPAMQRRKLVLDFRPSSEELHIEGDAVRLEQIVGNLVGNSIKFSAEGGVIAVETRREGDEAVVVVRDSGSGIAPELMPHVFDLFRQEDRTLERSKGGLGIGLTLVRRLMELHHGSVEAGSPGINQGAVFTLRFPRSSGTELAAGAHDELPPQSPRTILLVEDNPDIRTTLSMLLQLWGHRLSVADNGTDGLRMAVQLKPEVLLVDIGLPGMDGFQLARGVRAQAGEWARRAKIIAITGYGYAADRIKSAEAGFDNHLLKPVSADDLRRAIG